MSVASISSLQLLNLKTFLFPPTLLSADGSSFSTASFALRPVSPLSSETDRIK